MPGGLTTREVEVLLLVATGATNKEVADALVVSKRTEPLPVIWNNTLVKPRSLLAGGTVYAYERHLV